MVKQMQETIELTEEQERQYYRDMRLYSNKVGRRLTIGEMKAIRLEASKS